MHSTSRTISEAEAPILSPSIGAHVTNTGPQTSSRFALTGGSVAVLTWELLGVAVIVSVCIRLCQHASIAVFGGWLWSGTLAWSGEVFALSGLQATSAAYREEVRNGEVVSRCFSLLAGTVYKGHGNKSSKMAQPCQKLSFLGVAG